MGCFRAVGLLEGEVPSYSDFLEIRRKLMAELGLQAPFPSTFATPHHQRPRDVVLEPDMARMFGHVAGFGLPPGLVLRLFLLLHVGGGLAAPVLVVDLDHLFAGRLIAALRLRRRLRSRTFAFAAGHSQTVHEPAASARKRTHPSCRRQAIAT